MSVHPYTQLQYYHFNYSAAILKKTYLVHVGGTFVFANVSLCVYMCKWLFFSCSSMLFIGSYVYLLVAHCISCCFNHGCFISHNPFSKQKLCFAATYTLNFNLTLEWFSLTCEIHFSILHFITLCLFCFLLYFSVITLYYTLTITLCFTG